MVVVIVLQYAKYLWAGECLSWHRGYVSVERFPATKQSIDSFLFSFVPMCVSRIHHLKVSKYEYHALRTVSVADFDWLVTVAVSTMDVAKQAKYGSESKVMLDGVQYVF